LLIVAIAGLFLPIETSAQVLFLGVRTPVGSSFKTPFGTAVDRNGNVFVADYTNLAVYEIVASNGVVSSNSNVITLPPPSAGYSEPVGVAVDKNGDVFVADAGTANAVYEIVAVNGTVNSSSIVSKLAGLPIYGFPNDLVVDGKGDLFIAYPDNSEVFEIVAAGGVISSTSPVITLPAPVGGWGPGGVTVDGSGNVFVADAGRSTLFEVPAAGGYTTVKTIDTATNGAETVAADRNGDVFFIGNFGQVLFEISASGNYSTVNLLAIGFSGQYFGMAVDDHGNIFIGDAATSLVYELPLERVNFGSQAVGSPSAPISMPFNISLSGPTTIGSVAILTTGSAGRDFSDAGSSTCVAATYPNSINCVVNVSFSPLASGLRRGAVVFFDGTGKVLASVPISGVGTGPQIAFLPGTQTILASGSFISPSGVAVDASGNVFIADSGKTAVTEALAAGGYTTVNTLGSGFSQPAGVAIDGSGNLFIADSGNSAVKEIAAVGGYTTVTTLGSGFSQPAGIALDGGGNVFVADAGNNAVYEILAAGSYTTINTLGSGFHSPTGVAVDASGNVFVADSGNNSVKEILAVGDFTTINTLGSGFAKPVGVAVDGSGSVYVTDATNDAVYAIPAFGGYTTVTPLGTGFNNPAGIVVDGSGNVLVADRGNLALKKLDFADPPSLTFATTPVASTSIDSPRTVEIQNIGNQTLALTGLSFPIDFPEGSGDANSCTGSSSLSPGQQCDLRIDFTPLSQGTLSESVTLTDNALNVVGATQSIHVSGAVQSTPSITWATPATIAFGTALSATQLNATASVPGTFAYNPGLGSVLSAGSHLLSVTFTPTDTTDYTSATSGVTLTVSQATPVIKWTPAPLQVGSFLGAAQLDATANVPGTFAYTPGSGSVLSAGSHLLSVTFTPTDTTDYTSATSSVTLTVSQASPVIAWTPAPLQIGSSLGAAQLDATANVPGTFIYTPPSGTVIATSSQTLSVLFTPTDTTDYSSASKSVPLTITKAPTSIAFFANPASLSRGQSDLLTATVTSSSSLSGTVVFTSGATTLCTATLNASGVGSCSFTPSTLGNLTITAQYQGDANHLASSTSLILFVYDAAINLQLSSLQLVYPGAAEVAVCITPTSATGTVQIYDGTTLLTTQSLILGGCVYWYISPGLSVGTHLLTAAYSGDKNNPSGTSLPITVTVSPVPVSLATSCWNASFAYGANYQCNISLSSAGGPPQGSITYSYDGGSPVTVPLANGTALFTITTPKAGAHTVIVAYAKQTNYAAATSQVETFTVTPAPVIVALVPSSWYAVAGTSLTFQAAVSSWSAGAPNATGAVSFFDGAKLLSTVTVNASGQASYTTNSLAAGSHTITATYSGATNYASGSSSVTITLTK
jgi:sugar lactone lactonase YvrE